jgi:hypothetical protein
MPEQHRARRDVVMTLGNHQYALSEGDTVSVIDRVGNSRVTIDIGDGDRESVNASWFLMNFKKVDQ